MKGLVYNRHHILPFCHPFPIYRVPRAVLANYVQMKVVTNYTARVSHPSIPPLEPRIAHFVDLTEIITTEHRISHLRSESPPAPRRLFGVYIDKHPRDEGNRGEVQEDSIRGISSMDQ